MAESGTPARAGRRGLLGRIERSQGLLVPWSVALVLSVVTAVFGPIDHRWEWFSAAAGVSLIVTFIVHIIIGRADGFVIRASTAAFGCVLVVGLVSVITTLFAAVTLGVSVFPTEFS